MRAAVCRSYGPPEVVEVEEIPAPALGPGQVRVQVGAAAVNFPDVLLVANEYQIHVEPPFVPGSEFAGVVSELGDSVGTVAVGDRVTGTGL
ncbi:MAG TPA: alcohol dehydrogenase catalytic domain-containing protein, partial [Acidimicrobiia bacterium]|nr:alcohol dehydrogenase catalytic domain-containing protein [Acidimicrobiia bacterium]